MGVHGVGQAVERGFAQAGQIQRCRVGKPGPGEQCGQRRGVVEDAVQISAHDLAILRHCTVTTAIVQLQQRLRQRHTGAEAAMDFVAADRCATGQQPATDAVQLLVRLQCGLQCQPAQPGAAAGCAFDAMRVVHLFAQHLQAAADAEQLAAVAQMPRDRRFPTLRA